MSGPPKIPTALEKEEGEVDGDEAKTTPKKGRKNRGGKGRPSPRGKKPKPDAAADPSGAKALVASPPNTAPTAPSLLSLISPLMVSGVADPLLLSVAKPSSASTASTVAPVPPPEIVTLAKGERKPKAPEKPKPSRPEREFVPRLPCKFFLKGRCEKGTDCTFLHNVEIPRKLEVCKFFKSGVCMKGNECLFSHSFKDEICIYLLRGECTAASRCKYSHDREAYDAGKIAGPAPTAAPSKPAAVIAAATSTRSVDAASSVTIGVPNSATSAANTRPLVIALSESSSSGDA